MVSISPKMVRRSIKEYVLITFGLLCYAFAWVAIILPAGIVGGGVAGMSLLIYYATNIPLAYSMFVINTLLLITATILVGFKFSVKTLYAVIMMAVLIGFMQEFLPENLLGIGDDQLLSGLLAGAIAGIGISICFSQGGSTGGTDIIAMIINKFRSVSYGRVIMTCDFIIIGLSYFIASEGVEAGDRIATMIYSYVVVGAMGYTLDAVLAGNKQSSQVLIMSRKHEEIASHVVEDAHRGVTILDGEGWYSKSQIKVLMVICRKNETGMLLRLVRDIDPDAFVTVGSVMGVYGKGFDAIKVKGGKKGKKKISEPNPA